MGPSDVEWLNVDRRMAKRNKIKTLISTQMLEAIRIINVTPPRPSENVTLRLIIVDRATIATSPEPI